MTPRRVMDGEDAEEVGVELSIARGEIPVPLLPTELFELVHSKPMKVPLALKNEERSVVVVPLLEREDDHVEFRLEKGRRVPLLRRSEPFERRVEFAREK